MSKATKNQTPEVTTPPVKTIHDLKLHESLRIHPTLSVVRVPGGWIYLYEHTIDSSGEVNTAVFVPYSKEFTTKRDD